MRLLVEPYVECVARVRMLERGLLTRSDLEQALGRPSAEEVLSDPRFIPSGWAGGKRATLLRARQENLALLTSLTYDAPMIEVFRYPADAERLRGALKARLTGREFPPKVPVGVGTLPDESIGRLAEGKPSEGVPEALVEAVEKALESWEREAGLAALDRLIDEGQLAWQKSAARRWRSPFLVSYFTLVVDLTNLRSVARAKRAGWPPERAADLLIREGEIEPKAMAESAVDQPGTWRELLSGTRYEKLIGLAESHEEMELEAERVRLGFLRTTREALEGIEPLLAFYLARERDIMTLATIGAGLEAGMPPEAIRRRAGPVWWEC